MAVLCSSSTVLACLFWLKILQPFYDSLDFVRDNPGEPVPEDTFRNLQNEDNTGRCTNNLDGVAVHPDCWCVCLCYLHFAQENPEGGEMYLLVPAHPGCPGQSSESCKMAVCVCVLE